MTRPPAELAWLVDLVGARPALRLIEARGGTRVYVPRTPAEGSALVRDVGLAPAQALAAAYGGETITVPVARHWRVREYRAAGLSYAAIARKLGCHEDTVWRLLKSAGETSQLSLPI
jgi:hypothetical protein